ncbi:MAG: hypothetical protein ACPGC9_00030 [Cytophagales bacterium]
MILNGKKAHFRHLKTDHWQNKNDCYNWVRGPGGEWGQLWAGNSNHIEDIDCTYQDPASFTGKGDTLKITLGNQVISLQYTKKGNKYNVSSGGVTPSKKEKERTVNWKHIVAGGVILSMLIVAGYFLLHYLFPDVFPM